jgi:FtsH-binding integral membrane protein
MTELQPPTPSAADDWEHYRALREQWTHEDHLINHRLMWLILAQGLLFTAYGTLTAAKARWLIFGFPLFGIAVAVVIGVSIFSALRAANNIQQRFDQAMLDRLCLLAPEGPTREGGMLAAKALPFVFGTLWILAMFGAFEHG